MQTQEMYWKQKYDTLEENYNILKNDFEKNQNTSKSISKYIINFSYLIYLHHRVLV